MAWIAVGRAAICEYISTTPRKCARALLMADYIAPKQTGQRVGLRVDCMEMKYTSR